MNVDVTIASALALATAGLAVFGIYRFFKLRHVSSIAAISNLLLYLPFVLWSATFAYLAINDTRAPAAMQYVVWSLVLSNAVSVVSVTVALSRFTRSR